jgi:hypothetical protein
MVPREVDKWEQRHVESLLCNLVVSLVILQTVRSRVCGVTALLLLMIMSLIMMIIMMIMMMMLKIGGRGRRIRRIRRQSSSLDAKWLCGEENPPGFVRPKFWYQNRGTNVSHGYLGWGVNGSGR